MSDWLNTRGGMQFAASISSIARSLEKISEKMDSANADEKSGNAYAENFTHGWAKEQLGKVKSLAEENIRELNILIDNEDDELADLLVGTVGILEEYINITKAVNK